MVTFGLYLTTQPWAGLCRMLFQHCHPYLYPLNKSCKERRAPYLGGCVPPLPNLCAIGRPLRANVNSQNSRHCHVKAQWTVWFWALSIWFSVAISTHCIKSFFKQTLRGMLKVSFKEMVCLAIFENIEYWFDFQGLFLYVRYPRASCNSLCSYFDTWGALPFVFWSLFPLLLGLWNCNKSSCRKSFKPDL